MKKSLIQNKKKIIRLTIISTIVVISVVIVVCNALVTGSASSSLVACGVPNERIFRIMPVFER